jgi:hypothetical protein
MAEEAGSGGCQHLFGQRTWEDRIDRFVASLRGVFPFCTATRQPVPMAIRVADGCVEFERCDDRRRRDLVKDRVGGR